MPTARDRAPRSRRRLLPLTAFIAAAVALLAFAGTAAAETKVGEGVSPEQLSLPGEADLLKASASFEVGTGALTFQITTREAQESTPEERPAVKYLGILETAHTACTQKAIEAEGEKAFEEENQSSLFPIVEVLSENRQLDPKTLPPGVPPAQAYGAYVTSEKEVGLPEFLFPGSKSLSGTTATVSATVPAATNGSFNCAEIFAEDFARGGEPDGIFLPLTTKPEPPPGQTVTPAATQSAPAPAPAGVLSLAKLKPLKLKVGKWTTVKVNVTNTGGTASAPGSLQLKTTKGVVVKPARQKLPALLPGGSWTVTYKVKLTAKAKKSSTLALVGAAGSLAVKSTLILKSLG